MIKMSRKAKKAMAVALTAGMLASTAATPVMAATAGWKQNAKGWWYENADGTYPANKWQSINGKWYYFDANGYMASGWQSINGKWYYFGGANDGAMKSGWQPIGGKWYYLGEAEDGSMKDGWFKDYTGQYSYAEPGVGAIYQDGWKQEPNGAWYYLNPDGYMVEGGWVESAGKRYFLDKDGVMQSGVIKVDDAVYYLGDSNDGSVKTGEQEIGDETYTFEADGKAIGDKIPEATKAFKKDGTPVALDPEERELSITGVGSITKNTSGDFVLTALLSEEAVAEDLKDTTLTLTKGSIVVTAKFDSVSGATAVYKIVDATKLTPQNSSADGKYVVTGTGIEIDSNCNDASYQETLVANAVQGFVYYIKADGGIVPIKDATVKVGNKTVVTDENGYYDIYSLSGLMTVKVTASGYFENEGDVEVNANYPSALNIELQKYDQEELFITGIVATEDTGNAPVPGAKVELLNAKKETIATVITGTDGKYVFQNSDQKGATDSSPVETDNIYTFGSSDANKLHEDNAYTIKITKSYNAYDSGFVNLSSAYHEATYEVPMNKFGAETNLNRKTIRPVKKLQSVTLSTTWADDATLPAVDANGATSSALTVNFIDQDGKTVLADANDVDVVALDGKSMKSPAELIDTVFSGDKPTLESGTYYMVIKDDVKSDGVAKNAYCVIPVTITEGENVAATGTIKPAAKTSLQTKVSVIGNKVTDLYDNVSAPNAKVVNADGDGLEDKSVGVKYDVYQTVGGKNVYVYTTNNDVETPFDYNSTEKSVNVNIAIEQLVTGEKYVCKPTQSHITAKDKNITAPTVASIPNETNEVKSAADIVYLSMPTDAGKWVKADGETESTFDRTKATITSIKIVNASDNSIVAEATDIKDVNLTSTASLNKDELKGISVLDDKGEYIEYKAIIFVDGFELVTTEKFTLLDFQDAEITYEKTMTEIAETSVAGSICYDDGIILDQDASIILYNENNVVVVVSKYTKDPILDEYTGKYQIENGTNATIGSGNYTMVVRGEGFETFKVSITLTANKVASQKIELKKHVGGLAKLTVRDTNNYGYGSLNAGGITLLDEYYVDPSNEVLDKYDYLDTLTGDDTGAGELDMDSNFIGEFAVISADARGIEFKSSPILSVGTYTVKVNAIEDQVKGNASKDEVTISAINANGTANILLEAATTAKTTKLTVNFTSSASTSEVDGVVIEKEDGTFVDKKLVNGNETVPSSATADSVDFYVESNATYVVKVYAKGKYVASQEVTVQDFTKTVPVSLDVATRD